MWRLKIKIWGDIMTADITALPQVRGTYKLKEPLSRHTWLNVGGPADVMFMPADEADLQEFIRQKNPQTDVFVIGGGSNLLVRDSGIAGVVIKLSDKNFAQCQIDGSRLYCGAGCSNFALKNIVSANGLGGLEFLCSIPGTLGGAMRSNAGCFGSDMSKVLVSARVIDGNGRVFEVANEDFHFAYRYSDFPADWIVLEVCLSFEKRDVDVVRAQIAQNEEYRRAHQPQGIKTAGSTFKNPEGTAAWKLIKEAGGDTFVFGKAKMSAVHCNFLHNEGTSASDVENLCRAVQQAVKQKSGIDLETEVKIVGREQ
ncbi:MAG: UDP-N-acetylmuramate dehydrogenase [Alphaproteobacteria bacterium]|nr:UDP-N-acetylmuramate dehydrogenase [Alphaproteobacteria bacterium]